MVFDLQSFVWRSWFYPHMARTCRQSQLFPQKGLLGMCWRCKIGGDGELYTPEPNEWGRLKGWHGHVNPQNPGFGRSTALHAAQVAVRRSCWAPKKGCDMSVPRVGRTVESVALVKVTKVPKHEWCDVKWCDLEMLMWSDHRFWTAIVLAAVGLQYPRRIVESNLYSFLLNVEFSNWNNAAETLPVLQRWPTKLQPRISKA